jgi:hypothetical protein
MEMKSQGSSVNSGAEAIETIPSSPSAVPALRRGEIGEEARDLDHAAAALWPTARRTALRLGAAGLVLAAAPVRADEPPIDMDKIRELAAKKGSIDMSVPKSRDPLDKSLVEVVLGVNGAVIKLEPDELREMERVGFLVKDSFRGRAPEFWSLRDFTPRGWYSEPVDRFYGGLSGSPGSLLLSSAERSAANEERAASLRRSVAEKVAAVSNSPPPDNWEPPVKGDGKYCGYGDYRTLCSEKTTGQKFIEEYLNPTPKNKPPPVKLQVESPIEKLSKAVSSGEVELKLPLSSGN